MILLATLEFVVYLVKEQRFYTKDVAWDSIDANTFRCLAVFQLSLSLSLSLGFS